MVESIVSTRPRILYREGYKYQLNQKYSIQLKKIRPKHYIETPFISLGVNGRLDIEYGYAWDGASGPTRDTDSAMRGSLVHDALYQLMRMKVLPIEWRDEADDLFWNIIREDGMNRVRAFFWWRAVRRFAREGAAGEDRPVKAAP
jgi:hypothetical protein